MPLGLESRPVAESKHGRIGKGGGEGEKSFKTALIDSAKEAFEERAAIIEFDAGLPRVKAESLALREVSMKWGAEVAKEVRG